MYVCWWQIHSTCLKNFIFAFLQVRSQHTLLSLFLYLYYVSPLHLAAFNIFLFITALHQFDYGMFWCDFLWAYLVWACSASWICDFIVHNIFGKCWPLFLQIFFSAPFSLLFLRLKHMFSLLILSHLPRFC